MTDLYTQLPWALHIWGSCAYISVKPQAHPCYNIYITLSIVMYGIACIYPSIPTLKVRYYTVIPYLIDLMSQKLRKRWLDDWKHKQYAINLQNLVHAGRLGFDSIHVGWLFVFMFKHLAHLFSLNVSEQYWKVWCRMKRIFISLCQTKFHVTRNEFC